MSHHLRDRVLTAMLLMLATTGCATSRGSHGGRTSGLFDAGDADESSASRESNERAPAAAYQEESAPSSMSAPVPVSAHVTSVASAIDFTSEVLEGVFAGPDGGGDKKAEAPPPPPPPPRAGADVPKDSSGDKPPVESSAAKRLVIYKGSFVVMVAGLDAAVDKLAARVTALGGYVESQNGNTNGNNATVTLRVPAEKFYEVVGELGAYGQVIQKDVSANDVTKKVFDTELRLETAEKSRQRLLDLLRSANKMDEILQIEAQVRRLTDEIEALKGELRFLKDQISLATIAVTFYSSAPQPTSVGARTRSRFEWINQVGLEQVLHSF